ncbi:MAG TPA: PEP-CTERM sorting domain-containing protein [Bryobacteraceae bacterium]|nr:PEP-CTERM sorting domain-containing protein [Bryobacteraceae bacterium]
MQNPRATIRQTRKTLIDRAAKFGVVVTITTAPSDAVPEPGTLGLISFGLAGLYWRSRRRGRG